MVTVMIKIDPEIVTKLLESRRNKTKEIWRKLRNIKQNVYEMYLRVRTLSSIM
jgi:thymidylate kinase